MSRVHEQHPNDSACANVQATDLPDDDQCVVPGVPADLASVIAEHLIDRGVFAPMFLTVEDAARMFHIAERVVRKWIEQRRVPATKVGKRWILPRDALLRHIEAMAERNVARPGAWRRTSDA